MTTQTTSRPRTYAEALVALRHAQKAPAKGSPAYSRFVNRRIGRFIAAAAYQIGLSPNHVTYISALFSAAGIAVLATVQPSFGTGLLVAVLLLVGYAFDSADGQLARLRGGGTPAGEWLDHVVDSVKEPALHLAILVSLYRFTDVAPAVLLLPIAFTLVASVHFFVTILTDQLRRAHASGSARPAAGAPSVLRSLVVLPTDYGVFCVGLLLLGWLGGFLVLYGALLAGTTLYLLAALPKWYREIAGFTTR